MSRTSHFVRRHAAVLVAVLLLTGGTAAYGLVQADRDDKAVASKIYACVKAKTRAMTQATAAKACPNGSKKISWNVRGLPGARGLAGPAGVAGVDGQDGTDFQGASAYVYNTASVVIGLEIDVPFDTNGLLEGVTHSPGSQGVVVLTSGRYDVRFVVSAVEPNQFALTLNDVVIPGSTYGSGAGTQQNSGEVLVDLVAGDVLTLRNHTSSSAVTLASPTGGSAASVNASLLITRISPGA